MALDDFSRYGAEPAPPAVVEQPPVNAAWAAAGAGAERPALDAGAAWNPYQGPRSEPAVRPYLSINDQQLATRGSRLAAQCLNGLVVIAVTYVGVFASGFLASAIGNENAASFLMLVGTGLPLGLLLIYNLRILAESGQSLGKKWLGIRIVRTTGEKATIFQLLVMRYLPMQVVGLIPVIGPLIVLVNLLMIFGEEQRCLHDRFADTQVVRC